MKHDVEAHAESKNIEAVPEEEICEGLENIEEHCNVDIVSGQPRVLGHKSYQFSWVKTKNYI